ncbi:MAG: hypothetical protein NVS3B26_22470 [Mycobacteriales bacterium]
MSILVRRQSCGRAGGAHMALRKSCAYRYTTNKCLSPTLASHAVKPPTDPIYISVPQQPGALSDTTAAVSAAANKFNAVRVDHVIIVDAHRLELAPFSVAGNTDEPHRDSQHFRRSSEPQRLPRE